MTFSDITDQRTLTESSNATIDDTPETPTALLDRARQHATDVVTEHFPDLPVETIDWEISHRAQRQAGVTKYDPTTHEITIALTWDTPMEIPHVPPTQFGSYEHYFIAQATKTGPY
ncbi:hypothetical protein [Haladaptatus sp. W1]|uniref:hypothetical protein n=1 Tax=Haladaptatus sp. W1 TaxID=1897478 RepID=UPI0020C74FBC|nr:hypothetical protein [Haladaptatus sp. W1]